MGYDMYIEQPEGLPEAKVYFRLNIFGMQSYRAIMHELGMLDRCVEAPHFPEYGELEQTSPSAKAFYELEYERARSMGSSHPTGLPYHKLGSNDGWLVTPREIEAALARYACSTPTECKESIARHDDWPAAWDYWKDWIAFLRRAEKRGGFRVW